MAKDESSDDIDLQNIIDQMRAKGTICSAGDEMSEINRKKKDDASRRRREIWDGIKSCTDAE